MAPATQAQLIQGIIKFGAATVFCVVFYVESVRPQIRQNIETQRSIVEANKVNADTQRKMTENQQVMVDTQSKMADTAHQSSTAQLQSAEAQKQTAVAIESINNILQHNLKHIDDLQQRVEKASAPE